MYTNAVKGLELDHNHKFLYFYSNSPYYDDALVKSFDSRPVFRVYIQDFTFLRFRAQLEIHYAEDVGARGP